MNARALTSARIPLVEKGCDPHGPMDGATWVEVTCELLHEFFAIHPAIGNLSPLRFVGNWTLTHIPTGLRFCDAEEPAYLREAAERLAGLEVDWATLDREVAKALPAEVRQQIGSITATARLLGCYE